MLDVFSRLDCFDKKGYPPSEGMEVDVQLNQLPSVYLPAFFSEIVFYAIALKNNPAYIIQPKQCGEINAFDLDMAASACIELDGQLKALREADVSAPVDVTLTFSVVGTDRSYSYTFADAEWLGYLVFDVAHQIKRSGEEARETRSQTHQLLIDSGISSGYFRRAGVAFQSAPKNEKTKSEHPSCAARTIGFMQLVKLPPREIIAFMRDDKSGITDIPFTDEAILLYVAARLAPYVKPISDRMALATLLAIFHFERPALRLLPADKQEQIRFLAPAVYAIERVIDFACKNELKGVKSREMDNDHPIVMRSLASIAQRDPAVFFELTHDLANQSQS